MTNKEQTTAENLKKVLAVNAKINSTLQIGELLEVIMTTAAEVMQTHVASLLLIDDDTQDLVFQVALGEKGENLKEKFRVKMGEGIAGTVAQTGQSLVVQDVSKDPRFAKRFDASTGFVTKSILCVPMHAQGRIIGVLQAINPLGECGFTGEDQFLFETFADQAAIAVENARMHGELLKQERAKQELRIAHEIQQNFLPDLSQNKFRVDVAAKTIPARDVGGDFYDVISLDETRTAIVIGDVSGKGVPAALYMVRAISELRFLASRIADPAELITQLNIILAKNSPFGMFVTLLYIVIHHEEDTLTYCSAGHHPILCRRAEGTVESLPNAGGPPAGLAEGMVYEKNHLRTSPGDLLLMYTDGISEGRNTAKEEYGVERLKRCAQAAAPNASDYAQRILEDLNQFTKGAEPHDDVTLLTVKI